jgi:arabinofuranosyltransferase
MMNRKDIQRMQFWAWLACTAILIVQTQIIEDAIIMLRPVNQFWAGNGLVWNPGERVQVATSLPWQLLLVAFGWINPLWGMVVLSWVTSAATMAFTFKAARNWGALLVVTAVWLGFTMGRSYMACGLEIPLYAFFIMLASTQLNPHSKRWALAIGMIPAVRHDMILVAAPLALTQARDWVRKHGWTRPALMAAPLALITGFSVLYFGSLFPNTAYGKLGAWIPPQEVAERGWEYVRLSFKNDPLLWIIPLLAGWLGWKNQKLEVLALMAGWVLNILYAWLAAADYMTGRFLLGPCFLAIAILSKTKPVKMETVIGLIAIVAGWWLRDSEQNTRFMLRHEPTQGIVIKANRLFENGLFENDPWEYPEDPAFDIPRIGRGLLEGGQTLQGSIGIIGYLAPLDHYITDYLALADPVLARLPMRQEPNWRPGHYGRIIPEGLLAYRSGGKLEDIKDPEIQELVRLVESATRNPNLFDGERLKDLVSLQNWKPSPMLRLGLAYDFRKVPPGTRPKTIMPRQVALIEVPQGPKKGLTLEINQPFQATGIGRKGTFGKSIKRFPWTSGPNKIWSLDEIIDEDTRWVVVEAIKEKPPERITIQSVWETRGAPVNRKIPGGNTDSRNMIRWGNRITDSKIEPGKPIVLDIPRSLEGPCVIRFFPETTSPITVHQKEKKTEVMDGSTLGIEADSLVLESPEPQAVEWITFIPLLEK